MGEQYVYDDPEPYSFVRLLRLTSPIGASCIEGELITVSLKDGPSPVARPFTAISYTWGVADPVEKLWLEKDHYVPINASAAYVLRYAPRGSEIWIDSVCIDQKNDVEKEWVIPNLHQVYTEAQQVSIWLGPPSDAANMAFGLIRMIDQNLLWPDYLLEMFKGGSPGSFAAQQLEMDRRLEHSWSALAQLLNNPWFTRCWIIQEVVHAKAVTINCGEDAIPWDMLERAVSKITTDPSFLKRLLQPINAFPESLDRDTTHLEHGLGEAELNGINEELAAITSKANGRTPTALYAIKDLSFLKRMGSKQSWSTLQWNLLFFADNKATNPVDRIQALIWISYSTLKVKDLPSPSASPVEAYTQLTGKFMRVNKEIVALHMAGIGWPGRMAGLPSWVPDYTMQHRQGFYSGRITILGRITDTNFRAWNLVFSELPAKIKPEQSMWMLSLLGIQVDTVKAVVRPPPLKSGIWSAVNHGSVKERQCLITWFNSLESLISSHEGPTSRHSAQKRNVGVPEWEALAYSLVGGKELWELKNRYSPYVYKELRLGGFKEIYYSPVDGYRAFLAVLARLTLDPQLTSPWAKLDPETKDAAQVFGEALDDFSDWSVFRTLGGSFGRGPPMTEVDDTVCVFESARTPFILRRPCSKFVHALTFWSAYHVVGEAFVQGWMSREAMRLPTWKQWWFHLI